MARRELWRAWMALPFFAAFVACAGSPPPTARMASAEAAVRAAHDVGAERVPEAQLHVKLAEEQIARARTLINSGDNQRADLMLRRANADAELGVALAREDTTRDQAQRIIDQAHDIQQRAPQPDDHQEER